MPLSQQGAADVIDYSAEKVEDGVKRLTSGAGVDVVLDPVGIAQEAALRCLAWNGKLLIAGFAGGGIPSYAANRILLKGVSVIGVRAGEAGRHDPAMRKARAGGIAGARCEGAGAAAGVGAGAAGAVCGCDADAGGAAGDWAGGVGRRWRIARLRLRAAAPRISSGAKIARPRISVS